jgi:hypothetical protein
LSVDKFPRIQSCHECHYWYVATGTNAKYCEECGIEIDRQNQIINKRIARIRKKAEKIDPEILEARLEYCYAKLIGAIIQRCPDKGTTEDCETCTVNTYCPYW